MMTKFGKTGYIEKTGLILALALMGSNSWGADPISAVVVRNCGKVVSVFVTQDATHAARFGAESSAQYTVKDDGKIDIQPGAEMPIKQVEQLAMQAAMQMTVTIPCDGEETAPGQHSTSFKKVSDVTPPAEAQGKIDAAKPPDMPQGTSETVELHAVMFELAYDKSGAIRHSQVVGGYADVDACRSSMPAVYGLAASVEEGLTVQLECSGVRVQEKAAAEKKQEAKKGTTEL